jgi:demethylmenaquinone methyltransferase/2-methoxy-6-polyprenyl-1,4-benzoquinol methylase
VTGTADSGPPRAKESVSYDNASPLPEGKAKQDLVRSMFDSIAPRYDLINLLLTFGLDARWRRRAIAMLQLSPGSVVLDIGCGTGDLARCLGHMGHRSMGFDLSLGMLRAAHPGKAPLTQADAVAMPVRRASADAAVSGFAVRNFADLPGVLNELGRVVRPGARLALLEVGQPHNPLLRMGHGIWFSHVAPRVGAVLSDPSAYRYLPRSVAYLPSLPQLEEMLQESGFVDVRHHLLSGGIAQCVTATRSSTGAP